MPDEYFYKTLGMDFGPVSLKEIRELRSQDVLGPSDQFRVQGGPWRVVAEMDPDAPLSHDPAKPRSRSSNRLPLEATGGAAKSPPIADREEPAPWVFWAKTGAVGPLTTGQFLAAIQSGDVEPKTKVRFMQSTEWIAADAIPGLEFPASSPPESISISTPSAPRESIPNREMRQLFAECVTRQKSSQPSPLPVRSQTPGVSLPTGWMGSVSAGISFVVGVVALIFDWLLFILGFAMRSRIVWASTCVLLLFVFLPKFTAAWVTQEQDYATLSGTFTEWKELRTQDVDETIWEDFQERSSNQLSELIPRLEKRAHISDKSSMSLMWVARDYLPTLLVDPTSPSQEVATRIETHFAIVDAVKKKASETGETPQSQDFWMSGIVVLDLLVVLGAALFFGRKRWAKVSLPVTAE